MKVSIVGPIYPYRGGIARHTALLDQVLKRKHLTQVLSYSRQFPTWLYPGVSDKDPTIRHVETEVEFILDPFYPWTWSRASQKIRRFDPDITIIQWWTTFWALPYYYLCRSLQKNNHRVTYLIHNVLPHERRPWDVYLAKLALKGTQDFIVQNPHQKDLLLDLVPDAKTRVCQIPVFPQLSSQPIDRTKAREKLGLDQTSNVILIFGIVRQYKGLRELILALDKLKSRGLRPILVVAGEFWEAKHEYLDIIHELGIQDQVIIEDRYLPDERAHLYLSSADILAVPYTAGTQSAVASLGLSYGIPIISSKQIADGISPRGKHLVHVANPRDPDDLAEGIVNLLSSTVGERFQPIDPGEDWGRMADTIEEIAG